MIVDDTQFPESFYCPLTHEIMKDPVMDPEGNSYERAAIEKWLYQNSTSPITRTPLSKAYLVPNRALCDAIEARLKEMINPATAASNQTRQQQPMEKETSASPPTPLTTTITATARRATNTAANANVVDNSATKKEEYDVLISVKVQDVAEEGDKKVMRIPLNICCVIDVSGSMGAEDKLKTEGGAVESHGLSLLDIVKHAVKTIISTLQPEDKLAFVSYSNEAQTIFRLAPMTAAAKTQAIHELEKLTPDGSTNLWDGLHKGLELLRASSSSAPGRHSALLLLTDGLPNISPPRGEVPMLQRYKDQHQQLPGTINTFGFGYGINSELLRNIAIEGDGMYAFIPDSSFVGTTFVHVISNLLVTVGKNVSLAIEPLNGAMLVDVNGGSVFGHGKACQYTSWGASINLCSLQIGQSKDVVVRMSIPATASGSTPYLSATLKYDELQRSAVGVRQSSAAARPVECSIVATSRDGGDEVVAQRFRLLFVDRVRSAMELMEKKKPIAEAQALIKDFIDEATRAAAASNKNNSNTKSPFSTLIEDLSGQVTEAFSRYDWYTKWGIHYLPSLMRAHLLQQCNNFKDPGIQHYGGQSFRALRDEVDDIFCQLPPPKPSVRRSAYSSSSSSYSAPVRSMRAYNNASNPCFHGECSVQMADGSHKLVQDLKKGDLIYTPSGTAVKVVCVLKTHCPQGTAELVELSGGLLITPYHPVKIGRGSSDKKWYFPSDLGKAAELPCAAVYSFVLEYGHVMVINGVECVTLGHGFQDEVVRHPYFGSQCIIRDLQTMPGWSEGLVEFCDACMVRDEASQLVSGFVHHYQHNNVQLTA
eukprot:GEZU01032390.1.p1 GENE.GEZU01032390.1~~GEZU01032390.1.p1  ORF type:complete len:857 (+),score=225.75 GEZU01032390.1:111-2573(+)